jgi:hypothetical protein
MLHVKVIDKLWIGSCQSISPAFIKSNGITVPINVDPAILLETFQIPKGMKIGDLNNKIPYNSIRPEEYNAMTQKLIKIDDSIKKIIDSGQTVLLCCMTGRSIAPLIAGFYLIRHSEKKANPAEHKNHINSLVDYIKYIYMSPKDRQDELNDLVRVTKQTEKDEVLFNVDERALQATRREKLCFFPDNTFELMLRSMGDDDTKTNKTQ